MLHTIMNVEMKQRIELRDKIANMDVVELVQYHAEKAGFFKKKKTKIGHEDPSDIEEGRALITVEAQGKAIKEKLTKEEKEKLDDYRK